MVQVEVDFDEMMTKRNEEKRKLELKFKDVYQKIKDIKQFTVDEGKKVNDSLKAYSIRYDQQLVELDQEMEDTFNTENEYQKSEYKRGNDRI